MAIGGLFIEGHTSTNSLFQGIWDVNDEDGEDLRFSESLSSISDFFVSVSHCLVCENSFASRLWQFRTPRFSFCSTFYSLR